MPRESSTPRLDGRKAAAFLRDVTTRILAFFLIAVPLPALEITGFSAALNNRFSSGFPSSPQLNPSFVAGSGDWSGVGWASADPTKGFGFLTPQHFLVASHYGGSPGITVQSANGSLATAVQATVAATGTGLPINGVYDLSLGETTTPLSGIARYAILDLNASSTSSLPATVAGPGVILAGRGPDGASSPRAAATASSNITISGDTAYLQTPRTDVRYEIGDSGSPAFQLWTNPNGGPELLLLGNAAAVTDTSNVVNYAGSNAALAALNSLTNPDGYAVRVTGDPSAIWEGGTGGVANADNIARGANWSTGVVPTDKFTLFDAIQATVRSIEVNSATNLRGLFFKSTPGAGDGFSFSGAATLTIGRGGMVNYDTDRQVFSAPLALAAPQFWSAGAGGIEIATLNTGGHLLEISAEAASTVIITGPISGSGGIALSGGILDLRGNHTFTGGLWVHRGEMRVEGNASASGETRLGGDGTLSGAGRVGSISGSGVIAPSSILAATSLNPTAGLSMDFVLASSAPDFSNPAGSSNNVLRLISESPFGGLLAPANSIRLFLGDGPSTLAGGIFTDSGLDFLNQVAQATWSVFQQSEAGSMSFRGLNYIELAPAGYQISTVPHTATLDGATIEGRILQVTVVPEPAPAWLAAMSLALAVLVRRHRTVRNSRG
jgi:hypothetical protein